MPQNFVKKGRLSVDETLVSFIESEALPGSRIGPDVFWSALDRLISDFSPQNKALIAKRAALQKEIDDWHVERRGSALDPEAYEAFLRDIGYLVDEGDDFSIETTGVDPEIAAIAGPQLVVPLTNARYALNAANARWGSLYDALYGTDAIAEDDGASRSGAYNPNRGEKVVAWAKAFLDRAAPLAGQASHRDAAGYSVKDGTLKVSTPHGVRDLEEAVKFIGYRGDPEAPSAILLRNNGLHFEIVIDRNHAVGSSDPAGIADIVLESALTAIMDGEDSVAAVDAEDKVLVYRNWLGLMKGDLEDSFEKAGRHITRRLNANRRYTAADSAALTLSGRAVMLFRNVGHLMTTPAARDEHGDAIMEGLLDALVGALIGMHDMNKPADAPTKNSPSGSIYVVKPKMHGPEEAAFAASVFAFVETALGLAPNTIKIGLMDEERRTSVNLKACIRALKERLFFINTGFLDRTGDEIRTSMEAGPMMRKAAMKSTAWIAAYEDRNVDVGLKCGLRGKAQIGKGMWAMPDLMAKMLAEKVGHPQAGANTAWIPSPTAATLHATHYHDVDVSARQEQRAAELAKSGEPASLRALLTIPLADRPNWSSDEIREELENNAQGILGYVVRWVDQGVGCSKVPDIHNVALMEDRATLRISSQMIANWLHQGVVDEETVRGVMKRMAKVVDRQNENDPAYRPMAAHDSESIAFQAACALVFDGVNQPSGYTEPILHHWRLALKAREQASA